MSETTTKKFDWKILILGLQHLFAMFGATIVVPALTGLDVGVALCAAGAGTWLCHLITTRIG